MSEEKTVKKVFKNSPEGRRSVGKPQRRWSDYVENYLKKMAKNRDAWKLIPKEDRLVHGQ
jgi:hypothetical protein